MPDTLTIIPSARKDGFPSGTSATSCPRSSPTSSTTAFDADATQVDIDVSFEGEDSWIRIADNGTGMPTARINEAMQYGTDRDYADADLGKFGLGLKTASMSQCRRLTVATRTNPDRRDIEIRRWDLDHVMDGDSWQLMRLGTSEVRAATVEPLQESLPACLRG